MILFIDASVRSQSRTRRLAEYLLSKLAKKDEDVIAVRLCDEKFADLDEKTLNWRGIRCQDGDFSDEYFRWARDLARADRIVIAAPFWDLSFPASFKRYIEAVCINGLTFRYGEKGEPIGMCKAGELYYVCTAGGPVFCPQFGYGYVETLAKGMLGIEECHNITVENLDVYGADVEALMKKGMSKIDSIVV